MKTKQTVPTKSLSEKDLAPKAKLKSLRPMRSLVATRSFKPRTTVAGIMVKEETSTEK